MYFTFARQRVIIKTTKEKTNKKVKHKEDNIMKKTILEKIEATLTEYYGTYRH